MARLSLTQKLPLAQDQFLTYLAPAEGVTECSCDTIRMAKRNCEIRRRAKSSCDTRRRAKGSCDTRRIARCSCETRRRAKCNYDNTGALCATPFPLPST